MSIFNRPRVERVAPPLPMACDEALNTCIKLGVDINPDHANSLTDADLVRLAYREGVRATEQRLMSPDVADAIAVAIEEPSKIIAEGFTSSAAGRLGWQVAAVQQAAVYGVPK